MSNKPKVIPPVSYSDYLKAKEIVDSFERHKSKMRNKRMFAHLKFYKLNNNKAYINLLSLQLEYQKQLFLKNSDGCNSLLESIIEVRELIRDENFKLDKPKIP